MGSAPRFRRQSLEEIETQTLKLEPCCRTTRRRPSPLARSVPLSRFASRVGGGSACYVRPVYYALYYCSNSVRRSVASRGMPLAFSGLHPNSSFDSGDTATVSPDAHFRIRHPS